MFALKSNDPQSQQSQEPAHSDEARLATLRRFYVASTYCLVESRSAHTHAREIALASQQTTPECLSVADLQFVSPCC